MDTGPIIIAGFGRSGTTWLSDIISKTLGGLILFEPFHPLVFSSSKEYCYSGHLKDTDEVKEHINRCSFSIPENRWLVRNHLPVPIENSSLSYIEYLWKNSKVLGFKTIRLSHALSHLSKIFDARVIYIYRHPLAVLVSIMNRKNFWEEFGWSWHLSFFYKRTLIQKNFNSKDLKKLSILSKSIFTEEEEIVFIWAVSLILSLKQVKKCNGLLVCYENLYTDPYREIDHVLKTLACQKYSLHPSHFFTPSMTSLNTIHTKIELAEINPQYLDDLFWKTQLENRKATVLKNLISDVLEIDQQSFALVSRAGYLS